MIVRGTLIYLGLFCILRFVMKRQTSSLRTADILLIMVIADAAQNGLFKQYQLIGEGVVLVATIVFWDFFIDWLALQAARAGVRPRATANRAYPQRKADPTQHAPGNDQRGRVKGATAPARRRTDRRCEADGAISVVRRKPDVQNSRKTQDAG